MEFFVMELKFKYCKLCGNEYKRVCDLSYHIQHVHNIAPKEYYDRYLKVESEGICHNRLEFQKHKLVKEGYNPTLTEHEIMLSRNIYRIYDCGNLKYRFNKKSK